MSGDSRLRVGFELTGLELDSGGGGRAARRLGEELAGRQDVELVELRQPGRSRGGPLRLARGLARELWWFRRALPRRAANLGLDLLHCPFHLVPERSPLPLVVTVHDTLALDHPEWFTRANRLQARQALLPALGRAAAVLTPSAHTRARLLDAHGLRPGLVEVTPWGVDPVFASGEPAAGVLERLGVRGPYLLTVGTLQPRKNLEAVLGAFAGLGAAAAEHRLVVAGARGWRDRDLMRRLESPALAGRVHVTGRVSDEQLAALYQGATCFVLPSRGEGFGLPVLEAMACGTPVVCSDRTALPEVAGDAAALVDPDDHDALAGAIGELLADPARREELAARGIERAAGFTWERCAELTVAAYRRALERAA